MIDKADLDDMVMVELDSFDNTKPYDFIDKLVFKYCYSEHGMNVYDVTHDHYNKEYRHDIKLNKQQKMYLTIRDFTYSIIEWYNKQWEE